jgi:hypothetical protein
MLWRRRAGDGGAKWDAHAVDGGELSRAFSVLGSAAAEASSRAPSIALASLRKDSNAGAALLVLAGTPAWVNGDPVVGGLRVLVHRDEIVVGSELYCYSAHSRPIVSAFTLAAGARRPRCGVCRMAVEDGQAAVACPQCGRLYHQLEAAGEHGAKLCWTYLPACLCGHPTALGADEPWRPDREDFDD